MAQSPSRFLLLRNHGFSLTFAPIQNLILELRRMNPDPQHMNGMIAAFVGIYMIFLVIVLVIVIIPFWFILKKAGFSPWLALINIVPFGTLILLYVIAFAEWKVIPVAQAAFQPPSYPPYPPFPPQS